MLENETAYRSWRTHKLAAFAAGLESIRTPVAIADPKAPGTSQRAAIANRCRQCGLAFYELGADSTAKVRIDKGTLKLFWSYFGLRTLVANPSADTNTISDICTTAGSRYIPYTARALKWHTDGYYNSATNTIRAFAMHCVRPAEKGGENQFFDPEILYILLRDENPDYIAALMHPETLTIPQNHEEEALDDHRPRRSAPMLALCPKSGDLVARYTQRSRHVSWRNDALTEKARRFTREVLDTPGKYRIDYRLDCKEGVICNNIIHNRNHFSDAPESKSQRLLYRARYRERVAETGYLTLVA